MNRPETPGRLMPIPDVQSGLDERKLAIDRVGIKGLRYPLHFADGDGAVHATIATCNVYVALPEEQKGTHMSRLVALLEQQAMPDAPAFRSRACDRSSSSSSRAWPRPAVASKSRFLSSCASSRRCPALRACSTTTCG